MAFFQSLQNWCGKNFQLSYVGQLSVVRIQCTMTIIQPKDTVLVQTLIIYYIVL